MTPATQTIHRATQTEACERDDRYDEVWNGELYVPPIAGFFHQSFATRLSAILCRVIDPDTGEILAGVNVSDRREGWSHNYRIPDIAVYLASNPAVIHEAFAEGGPDLAVEITSPGEDPHAKLDFYAGVNSREVLIVRRDAGWRLELFRLSGAQLVQVGDIGPGDAAVACESVGLSFQVEHAEPRPGVIVTHPATGRQWRA